MNLDIHLQLISIQDGCRSPLTLNLNNLSVSLLHIIHINPKVSVVVAETDPQYIF